MAKIVDPDDLVVGTNLSFDLTASPPTFTLYAGGSLVAKDGVTIQAVWSKFIDLWTTAAYNKYPFPMYAIDVRSGQFIFGFSQGEYNGTKPGDDLTRNIIRDGGWEERDASGTLNRVYQGVVCGGSGWPVGAQIYYQRVSDGPKYDFTYDDLPNEAIQVFGDATNGNFDERAHFQVFGREEAYEFDAKQLSDIFESITGPWKIQFSLNSIADLKIVNTDTEVDTIAPYVDTPGMSLGYYSTGQLKDVGGSNYLFSTVIQTNDATLQQIYTYCNRRLRLATDINDDGDDGAKVGQVQDQLCWFIGNTLHFKQGVYPDGLNANYQNDVVITDDGGTQRDFPIVAAGTIKFDPLLVGGEYTMWFETLPGVDDDWGQSGAIIVDDASDADIAGIISATSLSFSFAYTTNVQGGRTSSSDAAVVVVATHQDSAKPSLARYTITSDKGQVISISAEQDRAYSNP